MKLNDFAQQVRLSILEMVMRGSSSHIGSAFSIVEILTTLYKGEVLRCDPNNAKWDSRDKLILSKGHAGAAVYATLAEMGFFAKERLLAHYQDGSKMSGHISHKDIPGVEWSTGSLGHGLGVGAGMAYAAKLKSKTSKTFVLLSDGECDEGSTWEAALFAAHHRLDNLVAIIDYNKLQSLGKVSDTLGLEPLRGKWEAFNWRCIEVDGHSTSEISSAITSNQIANSKPLVIIAHTIKGKGVSFMENSVLWHYRCPKGEEYQKAKSEILGYL
jgi:transketolase